MHKAFIAGLAALTAAIQPAFAAWELNMPVGVTAISREIYGLHMLVLYVCAAIGVIVFGAMAYSLFHHRKSRGAVAAKFHENIYAELLWTLIPLFILIALAVPAARALIKIEDASNSDLSVRVTGHQWKWEYEYLPDGPRFFSSLDQASREARDDPNADVSAVPNYLLEVDNPLVLPIGRKVRFLLTSNDVLHAWWVPEFAVKRDAIPGFINEMWTEIDEPGIYRGQCAELCGRDHGFMPIVVHAVSDAEFAAWKDAQAAAAAAEAESADREWTLDELMERGEGVYQTACAACHQPNGQGLAGVFPALDGNQAMMNDPNRHIDIVLNGAPGTAMQAFAAQLSDVDLAAVITYERNAWSNREGLAVQPTDIRAAR